ncbi:MAG: IS5 family transposase ISCaa6 [Holosporales bacterium]
MSLRYSKIHKKPTTFLRLFGIRVDQFNETLKKLEPKWKNKIEFRYKRPGRPNVLKLEDMLLVLLLYYRSYITQEFVGFLFGLDKSQVCRIIKRLEPLLAKVFSIKKARSLSKEEVEELIIDATEQPIERPKKKRHTQKTQITINKKGRIVDVSPPHPGSVHDFAIFKKEPPPPKDSRLFVDSGYQGIDKIHEPSEFPYKSTKNKPLDAQEKEYNHALSKIRIKVENILAQIKVFKIMSDRYRNKRKRYGIKMNIIAGIVNMKNAFA